MSKIGNLFQNIFKKNKKSQDSEEFVEEFDEDIEDSESDSTVIITQEELNEELIPHNSENINSQVPPDSELQFPDLPDEEIEEEEFSDIEEEPESITLDEHQSEDDQFENEELVMMTKTGENSVSQPEDEVSEEIESHNELDYLESEEEIEYDLSNEKLTIKEKLDQLKTRALDKFSKYNKKDLNQAYKSGLTSEDAHKNASLKNKIMDINWIEIPQKFFSKNLQNSYHRLFKVLATLLIVITIASAIGTLFNLNKDYDNLAKRNLLNLGDPNTLSKADLSQIKAAQVFKTEKIALVKNTGNTSVDKNIVCTSATRKSSANVKLINTIVLQDSVKSIASVQIRSSSKLQSIRVGESLLDQVKIDKIERLRLIVKNLKTGECESIESSKLLRTKPKGNAISVLSPRASKTYKKQLKKIDGIENDGNNFNIKKDFLKEKLGDISSILTQARGIQINNPDGTISFKVVDIEPGGVFAYLGVQDNDIITHINGEAITELNQVMGLFGKIGNIPNLKLTMKRAGEPITQNYNIK
jgi:type II secretory pathway component PulC